MARKDKKTFKMNPQYTQNNVIKFPLERRKRFSSSVTKGSKPKNKISYPKVSLQEWCDRYEGLSIEEFRCHDCNAVRVTDVPIDFGDEGKGLTSKNCENCGSDKTATLIMPTGKIVEKVSAIFNPEIY